MTGDIEGRYWYAQVASTTTRRTWAFPVFAMLALRTLLPVEFSLEAMPPYSGGWG